MFTRSRRVLTTLVVSAAAVALNPAVSAETQAATVCRPGWAAEQRPGAHVVRGFERAALPAGGEPRAFVVDHVMPISLGGAPRDPANLQLQSRDEARRKDVDEWRLHRAVCAGRMRLEEAQQQMRERWPSRSGGR